VTVRLRLRPWQREALDRFLASDAPDFLAVATPGAGKTTFALTATLAHLRDHPRARVVVVVPTQQLKHQWAHAAARVGLHLAPTWAARDGRLPADLHGAVVTYQQVAVQPEPLRGLAAGAFVVFDELHHAGDDRAWGDAVRRAFAPAARRLALSGTPFRSDTAAIPFVTYDDLGVAQPDHEYGYGDALRDGRVVRPVYFPRTDGRMEWVAPDGSSHSATFADALDPVLSGQRLRTALSVQGEWLPAVLAQAHARLLELRAQQPDAGGLVIAIDQDHARGIVDLLRRHHGVTATLVVSDDPGAPRRLEHFARTEVPWLVAVRMVSEGIDIPRLRVGVYATTTTTELFFRQATGRLVRWTPGLRRQQAFLYLPDDPRLRAHAEGIAQVRRHSLRRREDDDTAPDGALDELERPERAEEEQLSMFAVVSAVALGAPALPDWEADADATEADAEAGPDAELADELADDALVVALAAPPRAGRAGDGGAASPHERREELRVANAERANDLVRWTGLGHAQVHRELNRLSGVTRVSEATAAQLEARLRHAERWLARTHRTSGRSTAGTVAVQPSRRDGG
jgi:superfamily II DNA or RNA helicase